MALSVRPSGTFLDVLNAASPSAQVLSIEKMEDTSLLPSPVIVSVRGQMAFQFIELKDRDALVEALLGRLRRVQAAHPVHHSASQGDDRVRPPAVGPPRCPLVPTPRGASGCWLCGRLAIADSPRSCPQVEGGAVWGPQKLSPCGWACRHGPGLHPSPTRLPPSRGRTGDGRLSAGGV